MSYVGSRKCLVWCRFALRIEKICQFCRKKITANLDKIIPFKSWSDMPNRAGSPDLIGLTLAVEHVRDALSCGPQAAMSELRAAFVNGDVTARFEPDFPPDYYGPYLGEVVPKEFWVFALMFTVGDGFVTGLDMFSEPDDEAHTLKHRPLQISRYELLKVWPSRGGIVPEDDALALVSNSSVKARVSPATNKDIREFLTTLYKDQASPPNVNEAFQLVQRHFAALGKTAPRTRVRALLEEPQFATRRLPVGSRKSR